MKLTFRSVSDKLIWIAAIATPIITLPQLYKVWFQDATGVSIATWGSYLVLSMILAAYGIAHNDKPIIATYSAMVVIEVLLVVGILV